MSNLQFPDKIGSIIGISSSSFGDSPRYVIKIDEKYWQSIKYETIMYSEVYLGKIEDLKVTTIWLGDWDRFFRLYKIWKANNEKEKD